MRVSHYTTQFPTMCFTRCFTNQFFICPFLTYVYQIHIAFVEILVLTSFSTYRVFSYSEALFMYNILKTRSFNCFLLRLQVIVPKTAGEGFWWNTPSCHTTGGLDRPRFALGQWVLGPLRSIEQKRIRAHLFNQTGNEGPRPTTFN